jgi:Sec-independent protein translocase protein TatA
MFGISGAEFLIILVIAVAVIPARHWPDVARFLARAVKFVRDLVWKITDNVERMRSQIDIEKPIDDLVGGPDVRAAFATPAARRVRKKKAACPDKK